MGYEGNRGWNSRGDRGPGAKTHVFCWYSRLFRVVSAPPVMQIQLVQMRYGVAVSERVVFRLRSYGEFFGEGQAHL
jgi:hypothetical protein